MSNRTGKASRGPSWTEVIIGAFLSVVIGATLAAVYLILKPVTKVTTIPKDAPNGAVYYIEGIIDPSRAGQASDKLHSLAAGGTAALNEEELNALAEGPAAALADAASGAKPAPPPASGPFVRGQLNFRVHDGTLQIAAPMKMSAFGLDASIVVQARGAFAKRGNSVVFEPDAVYVGGCPVQRIPTAGTMVIERLLLPQPVPADAATAWSKLADASVDGSTLRLATQ